MYLKFMQWQFNICNPGFFYEFSREHRNQRWYVTIFHKASDLMLVKTILDDDIDGPECQFQKFLDEGIRDLESHLLEMKNGKAEEVSEDAETEEPAALAE